MHIANLTKCYLNKILFEKKEEIEQGNTSYEFWSEVESIKHIFLTVQY